MKYALLLLFLGGCGYYIPGFGTAGEVFYLSEDDPNIVYHCWIDEENNRPERWCEKEEGF